MTHQTISESATPPDIASLKRLRATLLEEHTDLDAAVTALALKPGPDLMTITRFKKKKLVLKDQMAELDKQIAALQPRTVTSRIADVARNAAGKLKLGMPRPSLQAVGAS